MRRLENEQILETGDDRSHAAALECGARDTRLTAPSLEGMIVRHAIDVEAAPPMLRDGSACRRRGVARAEKVLGERDTEVFRRTERHLPDEAAAKIDQGSPTVPRAHGAR